MSEKKKKIQKKTCFVFYANKILQIFSEQFAPFDSALRLGHRNSMRPPKACDHPERAFNRF